MTRAGWASAKFARHQLRQVLDHAYNPGAEPEDNNLDSDLIVSHENFFLICFDQLLAAWHTQMPWRS